MPTRLLLSGLPRSACFSALAALLLVAVGLAQSVPAPARSAPLQAELEQSGDLREFVLAYKATLPGRDTNAYLDADEAELATIVNAVRLALAGGLGGAARQLDGLGYDLLSFTDPAVGGAYLILRERTPCGRCWGLYVLNRSPTARNVAIEIPHPLFDTLTPEFGLEAFVRMGARAYLMAGTHRYANGPDSQVSDMAHNPRSLFQRLHEAVSDPDTEVLQYHGFTIRGHPDYPNVVLSNGSAEPQPELFRLQAAIQARGETAGVYDGQNWADLGATMNTQGAYTRAIGGRFYHMEHEFAIRSDPARRSALVEAALAALFAAQPK